MQLNGSIPTLKEMLKFLSDRCQILQGMKSENFKVNQAKPFANKSSSRQSLKTLLTTDFAYCYFCKDTHFMNMCGSFLKLPINSRIEESRKRHLCLNCLKKRHNPRECRNESSCQKCSKRHNTVLHLETTENKGT